MTWHKLFQWNGKDKSLTKLNPKAKEGRGNRGGCRLPFEEYIYVEKQRNESN